MQKVFLFATVIALTLASCGNKSQSNAPKADSTAVETVDSTAATTEEAATPLTEEAKATVENLTGELQKAITAKDSKATIATLANFQTIYKNLVVQGKLDEAKSYGSAIKTFVSNHADDIKNVAEGNTTVAQLVEGIKNLPTSASTTAEQAKEAIKQDVINLASPTIAKGATAIATAEAAAETVKNLPASVKTAAETAATQAVNNAKTSAENKAKEEVQKVNDKANAAVNNAKAKAAQEVNKANQKANDAINKAADKALKDLIKK